MESIVQAGSEFLDAAMFRTRQAWVETAVCRLKLNSKPVGTGFLIGPSVVMTNHHVVTSVIDGNAAPTAISCQFDYKRLPNGKEVSAGVEYGVVGGEGWLIAATPPTGEELSDQAKTQLPTMGQLDFALLRLKQAVGNLPLSDDMPMEPGQTASAPRAWLPFADGYDFPPDSPLFIMQHPHKAPLKLALASNGVIGVNANGDA
ncbi:MAG: trypsin-like peptidase domain-containing protein [Anaerolineales bacterium]|nr:trypsin-like peptidase domain-containing protein [Anaerolineales bacterium]